MLIYIHVVTIFNIVFNFIVLIDNLWIIINNITINSYILLICY